MATVRLNEVIAKMNLENLTPQIDVTKIRIRQPDINRPAVQMTGYFEHWSGRKRSIRNSFPWIFRASYSAENWSPTNSL